MKSMFEYMGTMIIMIVISFSFISFMSIEIQEINARNYHTRVIENIQYNGDYTNAVNEDYGDNIVLSLQPDGIVKVTYSYDISVPIFGNIKPMDIVGYAR